MSPRFILSLLVALGATACGASYQRIYEGDVRFEHCYRLDADPTISPQTRLTCWSEWTLLHTAGQNYDRIAYARRREAALRNGDTTPTGPALITGQSSSLATQHHALVAPAPSLSPTEPPTSPSAKATSRTVASPSSATGALSSQQLCARECGQTFTACVTYCDGPSCAQKCGNQVKVCLDACL
ncbi:MAG: hypothetical protein RMJ98_14530 [Myxococcales bacterium]|nr:hypothetical protein [Polyangiaceae bacterium]MDW8250508.1 hypothetical protein [Myxococcales bacterium]